MTSASQRLSRLHVQAEGVGGTRILRLDGELDAASARELRTVLAESATRAGELILDLSGLRALDADGLAAIVSGCSGARATPVIVGMRPRVSRFVQTAGYASQPPFA
jgi:anti-anti-sigma factor